MMNEQYIKNIEYLIDHENKILQQCAELINQRIQLANWPIDIKYSFFLALQGKGKNSESYKAYRTIRHLRIDKQLLKYENIQNPTALHFRCAERIRADLTRMVKFG
ncbi:hypothetical protein MHK_004713, partial [Candidatus Magnetomorum sp. HK-1]